MNPVIKSMVDGLAGKKPTSAPNKKEVVSALMSKPSSRDIVIIRHGATKLNNDDVSVDRIRGWKDIPLSDDGRKEAEKLGDKLKKTDVPHHMVTSDLKRAHETANIISDKIGVPVAEATESFRPWNVGEYAGEKSEKAIPILAHYAENTPDKPMPKGESFNQFKQRYFDGLKDALEKYPGKVAVVTHHRGERLLKAWKKAGFPANGDIDIKEFNQKGEATGHAENMSIPVSALKKV